LFSHTVPDDPDRRYVSLDRCSPAMYVCTRARAGGCAGAAPSTRPASIPRSLSLL
jgi:hypothetical protein